MIKLDFGGKYFTSMEDAVHLKDEEVQKMIDEVQEKLMRSKEPFDYTCIATGDTMVFGTKHGEEAWDEEINIYVTQNYQEASLYKERGVWTAVNWYKRDLEDMEKEELIEEIRRLRALYDPIKEY